MNGSLNFAASIGKDSSAWRFCRSWKWITQSRTFNIMPSSGFAACNCRRASKYSGYYESVYEPMWAALEETAMVINVHTSATQGVARTHYEGPRDVDPKKQALGLANKQAPAQQFLGNMILSGVFDRHPKLKVVCAEFDVGWVANLVQQVDYWFGRASTYDAEKNINKLPPSEYFRRNVFFTYQDDRAGVLTTSVYGEDNFLWASDYPHGVTTWPCSKETVDRTVPGSIR
jgi:predicted TIM-barrel fold metal-dependent hydrolase